MSQNALNPTGTMGSTLELDSRVYFAEQAAKPGVKKSKLPALLLDHLNEKDLKDFFKCSLAAWICTIFIFINPTLRTFGQAMFFGW
jgi:hypothetical protein